MVKLTKKFERSFKIMDEFVLITQGVRDSNNRSVVKVPPRTFDKILTLKNKTGISMKR